jgi:hypothetical protein
MNGSQFQGVTGLKEFKSTLIEGACSFTLSVGVSLAQGLASLPSQVSLFLDHRLKLGSKILETPVGFPVLDPGFVAQQLPFPLLLEGTMTAQSPLWHRPGDDKVEVEAAILLVDGQEMPPAIGQGLHHPETRLVDGLP